MARAFSSTGCPCLGSGVTRSGARDPATVPVSAAGGANASSDRFDIDGETAPGHEDANRRQIRGPLGEPGTGRLARRTVEERAGVFITGGDHLGHAPEASVASAELASGTDGISQYGIAIEIGR